MPYTPEEKKKAITRVRRIRGQTEALERALEEGTDCKVLLQQIAALRGGVNGLMSEVLESHLRETFDNTEKNVSAKEIRSALDNTLSLVRAYFK